VEGGERLHPHQVVEHHGGVGVVRPIVELRHRPARSPHNITQIKSNFFKTVAQLIERGVAQPSLGVWLSLSVNQCCGSVTFWYGS
jgi:hypothetical protein